MYYPVLRGKQFELAAIRDLAKESTLTSDKVFPVIEPVRENFSALQRTLEVLSETGVSSGFIINPRVGELASENYALLNFYHDQFLLSGSVIHPVLVVGSTTTANDIDDYRQLVSPENSRPLYFLHDSAVEDPIALSRLASLSDQNSEVVHLFEDENTSTLYRNKFKDFQRILIQDGFIPEDRNKDYKDKDLFTEFHVVYEDLNLSGFGDYQIVGLGYRESGGPAYAVALHLTYIDPGQDNVMFVRHFVSDSNETFADPGNKFAEALEKMIEFLDQNPGLIYESQAVKAFRSLHARGHFPGLGFVKKLSIQHHIELVDHYLSKK